MGRGARGRRAVARARVDRRARFVRARARRGLELPPVRAKSPLLPIAGRSWGAAVSSRELEGYRSGQPAQLADVLERVLDKGIVVAGDIQINLLDIELLTIKIRLLIASADKAREMGIDWWRDDPFLSARDGQSRLEERLRKLEEKAGLPTSEKEP